MSNLTATVESVRHGVDARLGVVLREYRQQWSSLSPAVDDLLDASEDLLGGGKRMRAVLAAVGLALCDQSGPWDAAVTGPTAVRLGAALELYQASAVIHDDVIDAAVSRRGMPAAHERYTTAHHSRGWRGTARVFGRNAAILAGDLLLSAAGAEMGQAVAASTAACAQALAARNAFDAMTAEVAVGQFLDVRGQALPLPEDGTDPAAAGESMRLAALEVVRHKSARYSVMHPLIIGALLGGVEPGSRLHGALAAFGESIGVAFQLRDDVLGVFGDPSVTGKPAGDDLREGKRTVLVAMTWQRADDAGRRLLAEVLSQPDAPPERIARAAALMEDCGARRAHEEEITAHVEAGMGALDGVEDLLDAERLGELRALAQLLTARRA